jgi:hypothetical protein
MHRCRAFDRSIAFEDNAIAHHRRPIPPIPPNRAAQWCVTLITFARQKFVLNRALDLR